MITASQAKELNSLIQEIRISDFFQTAKQFGVETIEIQILQKEFIFGVLRFDYYERMQTYVNSIAKSDYHWRTEPLFLEEKPHIIELIEDIIRIFCRFFKLHNDLNLEVEIVEKNDMRIKYIFFTDNNINISPEEFNTIFNEAQINFWHQLVSVQNVK